jgi:hypothetical protein
VCSCPPPGVVARLSAPPPIYLRSYPPPPNWRNNQIRNSHFCQSAGWTLPGGPTSSAHGQVLFPGGGTTYPSDLTCTWLVACGANFQASVDIPTSDFATEQGNDWLTVYEDAITLARLSGHLGNGISTIDEQHTATGSSLRLVFTSNAAINSNGFSFTYDCREKTTSVQNLTNAVVPDYSTDDNVPQPDTCNARVVATQVNLVNSHCCDSTCTGLPNSCSQRCAATFIPFFNLCGAYLASIDSNYANYLTFMQLCLQQNRVTHVRETPQVINGVCSKIVLTAATGYSVGTRTKNALGIYRLHMNDGLSCCATCGPIFQHTSNDFPWYLYQQVYQGTPYWRIGPDPCGDLAGIVNLALACVQGQTCPPPVPTQVPYDTALQGHWSAGNSFAMQDPTATMSQLCTTVRCTISTSLLPAHASWGTCRPGMQLDGDGENCQIGCDAGYTISVGKQPTCFDGMIDMAVTCVQDCTDDPTWTSTSGEYTCAEFQLGGYAVGQCDSIDGATRACAASCNPKCHSLGGSPSIQATVGTVSSVVVPMCPDASFGTTDCTYFDGGWIEFSCHAGTVLSFLFANGRTAGHFYDSDMVLAVRAGDGLTKLTAPQQQNSPIVGWPCLSTGTHYLNVQGNWGRPNYIVDMLITNDGHATDSAHVLDTVGNELLIHTTCSQNVRHEPDDNGGGGLYNVLINCTSTANGLPAFGGGGDAVVQFNATAGKTYTFGGRALGRAVSSAMNAHVVIYPSEALEASAGGTFGAGDLTVGTWAATPAGRLTSAQALGTTQVHFQNAYLGSKKVFPGQSFGDRNEFAWTCPGSGLYFAKISLNCDLSMISNFGDAMLGPGIGLASFTDRCGGAMGISLHEKVALATQVSLSEAQAQMAVLFPRQLEQQIASNLTLIQPNELQAQAAVMFHPHAGDIRIHCISTDGGTCRLRIHNLSASVAAANHDELTAQMATIFPAHIPSPVAMIPHEVIVSREIAIPNQDMCPLHASECRAQFAQMFTHHQVPHVAYVSALNPAGPMPGMASTTSVSAHVHVRAPDNNTAHLALQRITTCANAPNPPLANSEVDAQLAVLFPRAAGLPDCTAAQRIGNSTAQVTLDTPLVNTELNAQMATMFPAAALNSDVTVNFARPCTLDAGSECQAQFAELFSARRLPIISTVSTISDRPCATTVLGAATTPSTCLPMPVSGGGHRRTQSGRMGTIYVQVHVRATSEAQGFQQLAHFQSCVAQFSSSATHLSECLAVGISLV